MAAAVSPLTDSPVPALLQPWLAPDESLVWLAHGQSSPLEPHDGLTMAILRLTGRWRPQAVMVALTAHRLVWLDVSPGGATAVARSYRLPLKGRLVLQRRGVLERQFPGEPRVFVTFTDPALAGDLYRRIDEGQTAIQRAHGHVPEVVGVGVKPARVLNAEARGPHGETTVAQHEMVDEIRPSYRPPKVDG